MPKGFDPVAYVMSVGQELVSAFETAGFATTPGQIGSAREVPVRNKLMHLLPHGMAVGSGCVIDSFGNTSRQIDVVLYEKDVCPVFAINDDPASTYYPCEGVIAVGEVKSTLGSAELEDTFRKIESVKTLRRYARTSPSGLPGVEDSVAFRQYGSPLVIGGTKYQEYNQVINPLDQIYGFAIAGRIAISHELLCEKFIGFSVATGYRESPNVLVGLDGTLLCPLEIPADRANPNITVSAEESNSIYVVRHPRRSFPFLLSRLQTIYTTGRTVETPAFQRYIVGDGPLSLPSNGKVGQLPSRS